MMTVINKVRFISHLCCQFLALLKNNTFRQFVLTKHFNLNLIVLLLQCAIGCSVIICAKYFRLVELRQLKVEDIKSWIPVSTSLVFVIWTGSKALVSRKRLGRPTQSLCLSQAHFNSFTAISQYSHLHNFQESHNYIYCLWRKGVVWR